jgi:hypothetical protein
MQVESGLHLTGLIELGPKILVPARRNPDTRNRYLSIEISTKTELNF